MAIVPQIIQFGGGGLGPSNTHSIDLEASSSQYLSITNANITETAGNFPGKTHTGDFTAEAWVKAETIGIVQLIMSKMTSSGEYSWNLYVDNVNKINFIISADGTNLVRYQSDDAQITSTVVWYHIAVSTDVSEGDSGIKFYVNGSEINNTRVAGSAISSIFSSTSAFEIGSYLGGSTYWDGLIDEVRVWNDIRTGTEILNNYQKELTGSEANLVGYWRLNNDLTDETANNNTLTNNNSATFSTDVPFP